MGYRCDTLRGKGANGFKGLRVSPVILCAESVILCAKMPRNVLICRNFRSPLIEGSYKKKTDRACANVEAFRRPYTKTPLHTHENSVRP